MKPTVAISSGLADMRQLLEAEGYAVVSSKSRLRDADVVVVSGMEEDFMGMQDTQTPASVITAAGKDAHEILEDVRRCLSMR